MTSHLRSLKRLHQMLKLIGEVNAKYLVKTNPKVSKHNQFKTIHDFLKFDGNKLSEEQITAIIENKRVVGLEKGNIEVQNTLEVNKIVTKKKPHNERGIGF